MRVMVVLALAALSCATADERRTVTHVMGSVSGTSAIPAGWVTIDPTDELGRCANLSAHEWRVAVERGALTVTEVTVRERNSGPDLPFNLPRTLGPRHSRRHVMAVDGGFLVGLDAGEWGGSLHSFSADGQQRTQLASDNVHGLVAFGDEIVAIEGVTHLSMSKGNLRWLRHDGGAWREVALVALDAGPQTFVATHDALYVVTLKSLVRVGRDRKVKTIQPIRIFGVDLDSMAIDDAGQLWLGMSHFILRLTPRGNRYDETWMIPEGCQKTRVDEANYECVCEG